MATTNAIRHNLQAGTIASSLASDATTINFGQVPSFPTLNNAASGDYVPITLISSAALTNSEIVYLTAFTQGNSTGNIVRAQETVSGGGPATTWSVGASWEHAPSAADQYAPQAVVISGNTTGTTASMSAGTVTLAGGSNVTLSQSVNAVTIYSPDRYISAYPNVPVTTVFSNLVGGQNSSAATNTSVSVWVVPMALEAPLAYNEIYIPAVVSLTTTATTGNWSYTAGLTLGLYTLTGASLSLLSSFTNKQLGSITSNAVSGSGSVTWNASWGGSASQYTTASTWNTSTMTGANYYTVITGTKLVPLMTGSSASLPAGQYYMVAGATINTAGVSHASAFFQSFAEHAQASVTQPQVQGASSTAGTTQIYPLMGLASVLMRSDTTWPLSIATANITTSTGTANSTYLNRSLYVQFVLRTT